MRSIVIQTGCCLSREAGGPYESVSGLATSLARTQGLDVRVVGLYTRPEAWPSDRSRWAGVPVEAHPSLGYVSSVNLAIAIRNAAAQAAIVHDHGLWDPASLAVRFAISDIQQLVVSPRGMLEPWALSRSRAKKSIAWRLWQKRVLQSAVFLHATSSQEADSIRAIGLSNPIAVIPNGVSIPDVSPERLLEKRLGLAEPKRCVFLSRLHEKKGLPLLLQAWASLKPRGWTLEIAGFGESAYVANITQMIRGLGCDSIKVVGEKSGVAKAEFLEAASLFVLPSYSENFGVAVAEAMSYSIPVIATHGTPWKCLVDDRIGWWVAPTVDSIYDALKAATSLPTDELARMGRASRNYAAAQFSWDGVARSMSACYKWASSGGRLPECISMGRGPA